MAAFALGVVVVAENPGAFGVSDAVFLAIAAGGPFAAGTTVRARERRAREYADRAGEPQRRRGAGGQAAGAGERARNAPQLHAVAGPSIPVMTIHSAAARILVEPDPDAASERLLAVEESGREALAEMRRMLEVLRDDGDAAGLTPQPGVDDLEQLVADARAAGFDVDLAVEGSAVALSPGAGLSAYRIVQEALTNVRKHAAGAPAHVRVRYTAAGVELVVENDAGSGGSGGQGDAGGHGVIGMRERVGLYDGELDVGPRPGGGFAVRARLPVGVPAA